MGRVSQEEGCFGLLPKMHRISCVQVDSGDQEVTDCLL